jgi:hypothetical protein
MTPAIDLTPDYYRAIGEISARWNWLEFQLGVLIREGFGLDKKEGRVLTVGMAMKPKCHILRIMALKWVKDAQLRHDLTKLAKDCQNKIDDRHCHVHGVYAYLNDAPEKIGLMLIGSGEERYAPSLKEPILPDLQRIAGELRALQMRAQDITRRIKAQP